MAGVPLLNGFLSKEMFFAEAVASHDGSLLDQSMGWIALVASVLAVAYSLRFIHGVFFGPLPDDLPRQPHEPPFWMRFPVETLVVICLAVGIFPALTIGPYLLSAVESVIGPNAPEFSLAVWHGVNAPLIMSCIAFVGGVALYFLIQGWVARSPEGPPVFRLLQGKRIFERVLVTLSWKWARALFRFAGTERLQPQLRILVLMALGALVPIPVNRVTDYEEQIGRAVAQRTDGSLHRHPQVIHRIGHRLQPRGALFVGHGDPCQISVIGSRLQGFGSPRCQHQFRRAQPSQISQPLGRQRLHRQNNRALARP